MIMIIFLGPQSALHMEGEESPQTPPMCSIHHLDDAIGSHIVPERPPHTSLMVERRQSNTPTLFRRTPWDI